MILEPQIESLWINAILPEIVLAIAGMVLILVDAFSPRSRGLMAPLALVSLVLALVAETEVAPGIYFGGTWQVSGITQIFDFTFLLAAILTTMLAREYLWRENLESGEFYALLLWATIGMMMMGKGLDLLVVIVGLEMLSVCIFALVGYHRRIPISNEASLKYFLMGAFATGFILYGTAFFYGATGSTSIAKLGAYLATTPEIPGVVTLGLVMLIGGFGFKLALVPFHGWAPDVYQGAPGPVAGWLSVAPKAATLIALMRVIGAFVPASNRIDWPVIVMILSIASMVIGNFVAIAQRDLKRMLAYSGIAHVGYMMIAVLVLRTEAVAAVAVYTITYALMNIGAFGVVSLLDKNQNDPQTLDDIAGLGFRKPFYGLALALCMFSLAGLPPTAGFVSKFYVFKVAIESGAVAMAVIAILTSIVSVYYYLRVVYFLYMKEADGPVPLITEGIFSAGALVISMLGILLIGIFPTTLFRAAAEVASTLLQFP
ncbi:MAG TPA: NADH-quinone oxidoreductase subunit N [Thermoanaerobaculia bacterium]|nr:NADH-quinone oxidoreductase subunit N [Thermoanaerobaculia bacterium]